VSSELNRNWWQRSRSIGVAVALVGVAVMWSAHTPGSAAAAPPITVSPITAKFFANPTNDGAFTAKPGDTVDFSMTVPVLNWNPPSEAQVGCSNSTGIDEETRPFTDVVPQSDGTCTTTQAKNSTISEGCGDDTDCPGYAGPNRNAFNAEFEGVFTVAGAGDLTFNFFSDDGWILGIGPNGSNQPNYVSGDTAAPASNATTPFKSYKVVGENNTTHGPTQDDLVVHFPAAGDYPFEIDYAEAAAGQLAFTLDSAGAPIGATPGSTSSSSSTSTSTTASVTPTTQAPSTSTTVRTTATTVKVKGLSRTGSDESGLALAGLALLVGGAVIVTVAQQRRQGAHFRR
jgi:hypothetical protein